ncbi:zinc-ribbon domain-containing protein [Deferribacter abyssi]|uniref:zinc-ribbon domain-containing protein n=1 Tax=Deferribacter abyssi TaxID=213806 RepID=UPI003C2102A6
MKFCPECGTENKENKEVCENCGFEFDKLGGEVSLNQILEKLEIFEKKLSSISKSIKDKNVTIKDIDLGFYDIIGLMVKWALASIPAMIIVAVIFGLIGAFFGLGGLLFGPRY